jgi:hypothetical protein
MTETITLPDGQVAVAAAAHHPQPAAAVDHDLAPGQRQPGAGRQRRIQDCVDQILAKVDQKPTTS